MALKQKLLEFLELNRGDYLSGEQIASELGVTRAAIWKNIKVLRDEGYNIDAITNKGYMLKNEDDNISYMGISKYLCVGDDLRIEVYDEIDSTNKLLRSRIDEEEGLVVVAKEQIEGKARQGKIFFSPKDTGIYFSILLKPKFKEKEAFLITLMAGIAVCEGIKKTCCIEPHIRGVNDIYIDDKKICGIMTQASFSLEESITEYIILGIGINVYPPDGGFPEEISSAVGNLLNERRGNVKNMLLANVIGAFWRMYKNFDNLNIVDLYKKYNKSSNITISLS